MNSKLLVSAATVCSICSSFVFAYDIDMLTDKLAEKGVITYGEAQQIKDGKRGRKQEKNLCQARQAHARHGYRIWFLAGI